MITIVRLYLTLLLICLSALIILIVPTVSAHGLGITHTQKNNQYTIEFEQEESEIVAGISIPYTIRLRNEQGELTNFEELQIRFVDAQNRSIVSVRSKPDFRTGTTSLSLPIPLPGIVSVSTNFLIEQKSIAKANFSINVVPTPKKLDPWLIILPLIGIIAGSGSTLGFLFLKKSRLTQKNTSVKNGRIGQKRLK